MANPNIFQQYLQPPKSALAYGAEMDAAEGNQLELAGKRMQLQQSRSSMADAAAKRNAIQRVYDALGPQATPIDRARALQQNPLTAGEGVAAEKAINDAEHVGAQTGNLKATAAKTEWETRRAKRDVAISDITAFQDPQQAAESIQRNAAEGNIPPQAAQALLQRLAQVKDQGQFAMFQRDLVRSIMEAGKREEMAQARAIADQQSATTRRGQDITAGTAREGHEVTMRGQNLTDARARESTTATMTKPFEVTGQDGRPMLVQQDKQGNITPVAGFGPKAGASKPLNDSQAKALLFGSRMQEADKILGNLSAKGTDTPGFIKEVADNLPLVSGPAGAAANFTQSPDQQSAEQAQRDFVNAVLRRESGAAISDTEFASAKKQYFNARGDSTQVKKQKAANRQLAIKGLLAEVPEGQRGALSTAAPAQDGWTVKEVN